MFLKPILKDVEALRELLRKHKIGKLSDDEVEESAKKIFAEPAKQGGDRKSEEYKSKDNLSTDTQKARAKENGVHRKTQEKLDRLAKDRPDLLERVCAGELKVNTAAKLAGIVKDKSQEGLQANVPRIVYLTPS